MALQQTLLTVSQVYLSRTRSNEPRRYLISYVFLFLDTILPCLFTCNGEWSKIDFIFTSRIVKSQTRLLVRNFMQVWNETKNWFQSGFTVAKPIFFALGTSYFSHLIYKTFFHGFTTISYLSSIEFFCNANYESRLTLKWKNFFSNTPYTTFFYLKKKYA